MKRLLLALLLGLPAFVPEAHMLAQEGDRLALDPGKWSSATLPTPYGVVVGLRRSLVVGSVEDYPLPPDGYQYSVAGYYDAWQIGYSQYLYGDMFELGLRELGRDLMNGIVLQFGPDDYVHRRYVDSLDEYETITDSRSLFAVSFRFASAHMDIIHPTWNASPTFGLWTGGGDDGLLIAVQAGGGLRVPLRPVAFTLTAQAEGAFQVAGGYEDKSPVIGGVYVAVSAALNLDH